MADRPLTSTGAPGPRIYCILAAEAPAAAVLRRGPTGWCHLGRWDLEAPRYEPGAWFRGILYPQKCDLSPDGRWLAYSALKYPAAWKAGNVYQAISRLPWVHALAAWGMGTTYTRGVRFVDEPGHSDLGAPDVGDATPCLRRYGLRYNTAEQFAVERRRGWSEAPGTEPRAQDDVWDERRAVCMHKRRPGGSEELLVEGSYAAFRGNPAFRNPARYTLVRDGGPESLTGVQWADWDERGRLLVATEEGRIQMRALTPEGFTPVFDEDLAERKPTPTPAPEWAREW